jgi:hypothetical protein
LSLYSLISKKRLSSFEKDKKVGRGMKKQDLKLSFCLLMVLGLSLGLGAIDFGWMQPGVRAWYFGGVGLSGDMTSNAVEAYLIQSIAGGNVQYVRHSAVEFWTSPKPVENLGAPVNKGSFWIHPTVLQALAPGDFWLDQEILTVAHNTYTYATFGEGGMHYSLLPAKALFDLKAQREIVKITFRIDNFSIGTAFFDAETGLALMRNSRWQGGYAMFFILGEINYDFAQQAALAEDGGPHCGFKSRVAENALPGGGGHAGGVVDIQSGIETRYVNKIEMWVMSTYSGPYGMNTAIENYYFDGNVPIVRRINHDQAGNFPPEQWNPFGQYLPWWLPPTVTQGNAFSAVSLALSAINVFDVSMTKTADQPLTYTATQNPQRFYFSTLWFDSYGYLTQFSAKDPTIGLDIDADSIFGNGTMVYGLSYYRSTMGVATPGKPTTLPIFDGSDFDGDLRSDISVWRPAAGMWWLRDIGVCQWGEEGDIPIPGDYDGNGTTDIAIWRPSTAMWWIRDPYVRVIQWGEQGDIPVPGDYDGNGTTDIAIWRPSTGMWWIRDPYVRVIQWGEQGDIPVPGDYDGNGTTDIAIWRPSTGMWWIRDPYVRVIQWGEQGDIPVPGDYNGDIITDIAIWRPSTAMWWIRDPYVRVIQWGEEGDIPVPGDYDGNGITDIAIWRPSTGMWWIRGMGAIQWGEEADIPLVRGKT